MRKNRTRKASAKGTFGQGRSAPTRQSRLVGVILDARTALRELVLTAGLEVFTEMLEDDRAAICGPKHRPMPDRRAYRHGHDEGCLVFGGRKIRVKKPRIRSIEGEEIELGTWRRMADEDPLRDRVVEQILLGVSQRGYERSLEPLPAGVTARGTRRSSVSRQFQARTTQQTQSFLSRSLEGIDLPVILIDGTGLGDHMLLVRVGDRRVGQEARPGRRGRDNRERAGVPFAVP